MLVLQLKYNPSTVLAMAISTSCTKRGLLGDLYSALQMAVSARTQINSYASWQEDLESLDEDKWTQALEVLPKGLLSKRNG